MRRIDTESPLWPETQGPVSKQLQIKALDCFPEARRIAVSEIFSRMQGVAGKFQINDEVMFGFAPQEIQERISPQAQIHVIELAAALTPFKEDGKSWEEALQGAENSVVEKIKLLDMRQYGAFMHIMGAARDLVKVNLIRESGWEWDTARAAGWALLNEGKNPYAAVLSLDELMVEKLQFRHTSEDGKGLKERVVADFRLKHDFGEDDYNLWAACIAYPLVEGEERGAIYFHQLGEDCKRAKYFVEYPRQIR